MKERNWTPIKKLIDQAGGEGERKPSIPKMGYRVCPYFVICGLDSCEHFAPHKTFAEVIYCPDYKGNIGMRVRDRVSDTPSPLTVRMEYYDLLKDKDPGFIELIDVEHDKD